MRTRPLKTCRATVAPISAAAILSRNEEITNTRTRSTKPPVQLSGRAAGIQSGDAACLEMAGKESKADQKQKQVREENPFMLVMREEAC